jgi:hypothetical protein
VEQQLQAEPAAADAEVPAVPAEEAVAVSVDAPAEVAPV